MLFSEENSIKLTYWEFRGNNCCKVEIKFEIANSKTPHNY